MITLQNDCCMKIFLKFFTESLEVTWKSKGNM